MNETIAAIATPPGRGGVGIIRVSGPAVSAIAETMIGRLPKPRFAAHALFKNQSGDIVDDGIALYFPAPNSFTGEDVLELQGHGGPVVMDMLLHAVVELGVRLARPGEFSERAFLNDKLDLAQAEAIADLIDSGSRQAARSALRSLQGEFSDLVNDILQRLIHLRMHVESALDFPEEEIDFLADENIVRQADELIASLKNTLLRAQQGAVMREGVELVIVGQPNAGKSSLLNALSGQDSAIVTDIAGTTRDVLREFIQLDGLPVHLLDTAGLRESGDAVEEEGIRRTWKAVEAAHLVVHLIDHQQGISAAEEKIKKELPDDVTCITVFNKIDLSGHAAGEINNDVYISAKQGKGLDELKQTIKQAVGLVDSGEDQILARRRHLQALEDALLCVENAKQELLHSQAGELMAEQLRLAQDYLGSITGNFTADDLLGEIFSSFCIGK